MNTGKTIVVSSICAAILGGCATVSYEMPSGFNPNASKEIVRVHIQEPQIKGLENFPNWNLNHQIRRLIEDRLLKSSRFVVLATNDGSLGDAQSADIDIQPYVNFNGAVTRGCYLYRCTAPLSVRIIDRESGAYASDKTMTIDGYSAREMRVPVVQGKPRLTEAAVVGQIASCYDSVYYQLESEIEKTFPVSAKIQSVRIDGPQVKCLIKIGTNSGLEVGDEFLIYEKDANDIITVVARANGIIGEKISQLQIYAWNTTDYAVVNRIKPNMLSGIKCQNLFAVRLLKKGK